MSKGLKSSPKEAPKGQIWGNLSTKIKNDYSVFYFIGIHTAN